MLRLPVRIRLVRDLLSGFDYRHSRLEFSQLDALVGKST